MLRIRKLCSALLCAMLLAWYGSPQVHDLLCGPSVTDDPLGTYTLRLRTDQIVPARVSDDERLHTAAASTQQVCLFGAVPIRTLETGGTHPSVIPSGRAIGIVLATEGVQIVGLGGVQTGHGTVNPAAEAGLKPGDTILAINGTAIQSNAMFAQLCQTTDPIDLLCLREGQTYHIKLTPASDADGTSKIGAWVRDSTSGLGTLSFVDPTTNRFAALGHGVSDVDTGVLLRYGGGSVYRAVITGVQHASGGKAGELIGSFSTEEQSAIGTLLQNTPFGIAGTLQNVAADAIVPIADPKEIRLGDVEILSTVSGTEVRRYRARVIRLNVQASSETDGMMIEITDRNLIETTGGIVQGMSGSPVLQNGKLIGVVTHVFLGDSTRGYCIYAEQMYRKLLGDG